MSAAAITAYEIGIFVHVVAVVAAFGPLFAYPAFAVAAERSSAGLLPAFHRGIELSNRWLATPGMILVLASGLYAVADRSISLGESWVSIGFLGIIALFGMVHGFFVPRNRSALEVLERDLSGGGEPGEDYRELMGRIRIAGLIATLIVVVTIFFMVVKP